MAEGTGPAAEPDGTGTGDGNWAGRIDGGGGSSLAASTTARTKARTMRTSTRTRKRRTIHQHHRWPEFRSMPSAAGDR